MTGQSLSKRLQDISDAILTGGRAVADYDCPGLRLSCEPFDDHITVTATMGDLSVSIQLDSHVLPNPNVGREIATRLIRAVRGYMSCL